MKEMWNKVKEKILHNSFLKSVMTLSFGIIAGQIIVFFTKPIISRIYLPEAFGDFASLTSSASILSSILALGMMLAVMIPKEDEEAQRISNLILMNIIILGAGFTLIIILLKDTVHLFETSFAYVPACLLLFVYLMVTTMNSLYYSFCNRQRLYKVMFWNPILSAGINFILNIIFYLLKLGSVGYIVSAVISCSFTVIHMHVYTRPFDLKRIKYHELKCTLLKYKDFPQFQLPANIIGTFSEQLPVQLIARLFGNATLGIYSMTFSLLNIPISLLATPINRVYYKEAVEKYNAGENIGQFTFNILKANIKLAIIPVCILMSFGEQLFSLYLGEKWVEAGTFAEILGVWALVQFCSICISGGFVIIGKQNINLKFSLLSLVVNVISLLSGYLIFHNIIFSLIFFTVGKLLYHCFSTGLFFKMTGVSVKKYLCFVIQYIIIPAGLSILIKLILNSSGIL